MSRGKGSDQRVMFRCDAGKGGRGFAGPGRAICKGLATALGRSLAEREPSDAVETCTILITAANRVAAPVHGRMPLIVPRKVTAANCLRH